MDNSYLKNTVAVAVAIEPSFSHYYSIMVRCFPFYKPLVTLRKNKYNNQWIVRYNKDETSYIIPTDKSECQFSNSLTAIGIKKNRYMKLLLFNSNEKHIKSKSFYNLPSLIRHLYFLESSLDGLQIK